MKKLAKVFHAEFFGKREEKYEALNENDISSVEWEELKPVEPYYFFVPKDFESEEEYKKGFGIDELFPVNSNGLETHKDYVTIHHKEKDLENVIDYFKNHSEDEIKVKFKIEKEGRDWKVVTAKDDLISENGEKQKITYRPFDDRFTYFSSKSKGFLAYPRYDVLQHLNKDNIALLVKRQCKQKFSYAFIVDKPCEACVFESAYAKNQVFPLYLYNPDGTKTPNLNPEIVEKIVESVGISFVETKDFLSVQQKTNDYLSLLDYIYAILHSPSYREKYKEFLKIDFPRIPYPLETKDFLSLQELGKELRELHLLQSPKVNNFITTFPESGTNTVEKGYPKFVDQKIYINEKQYFGNVPEVAWNFYIGGYQPVQKWLKDRRNVEMNCNSSVQQNCNLSLQTEDIEHYQKMIMSLTETDKIMKEIDKVIKF